MPLWKSQIYDDSEKKLVVSRGREEGRDRQSTEDFQGSENTQHEVMMVDTYHYLYVIRIHLSKHTECTIPKANSNVNYGLSTTRTCYCRLVSCNKRATLVEGC